MSARASNRKAQMLTIAILGVVLVFALVRTRPWGGSAPPASPEDAIYGMLDAARAGDVAKYLGSYSGPLAVSLKQSFSGKPESEVARYLRESNASIKGVTVMTPQQITDRDVKVRVEYTYSDRTESQYLWLEKAGKSWKIARADAAEQIRTPIPYGTPVRD